MGDVAAWGGRESHHHRFVVQKQRVGAGVVGAQRLAVKRAGVTVRNVKSTSVKNDIAPNGSYACALKAAQQQPQALEHQLGIALPLDVYIAGKHAFTNGAIDKDGRCPGVRRPQKF